MTGVPWFEHPPPVSTLRQAVLMSAALTTAADVTASRARVRAAARASMPAAATGEDVDVLLLALEELASNAVRHGQHPVHLTVSSTTEGWLVDVVDEATDVPPAVPVGRDPARGGLGLQLVARLSVAHGCWAERGRKHVWACIKPMPLT